MNKRIISRLIPVLLVLACAALALVVSRSVGGPFWLYLVVAFAAILLNGIVATVEDDLPGGFNNPTGSDTPRYIGTMRAAFAAAVALMGAGTILSAVLLSNRPSFTVFVISLGGSLMLLALRAVRPSSISWIRWVLPGLLVIGMAVAYILR